MADLSALRAIGSTGSPLSEDCYRWVWDQLPKVDGKDIWLTPIAGGTDFAGAFIGGNPTLPVIAGEMQCRCLGASVEAWSEPDANGVGRPLIDEVGELVCTKPMPSMPLYFWGDAGNRRYTTATSTCTPASGATATGSASRSAAARSSTAAATPPSTATASAWAPSELYRAVEALPEVLDSLVVDLEYLGRESWMPLFVVLREGLVLDDGADQAHQAGHPRGAVGAPCAERRVPGQRRAAHAVGQEDGTAGEEAADGCRADSVLKRDAMANAECVDWFVALAASRATSTG